MKKFFFILAFLLVFVSPCSGFERHVNMYVPAVEKTDTGYRGVLATLSVIVKDGNGHVFVDTLPLTEIDTQAGARMAKEAVQEVLDIDLDKYNLFFIVRSDAPIVGGPSASGAMAVGIAACLLNLTIDNGVVMTGTIDIDGSIGPVGGLLEKAQAVAEYNGTKFLIPEGQSIIYIQQTNETETPFGISISEPKKINLKTYARDKWNLSVIEVSDINDVLRYMTGYVIEERHIKLNETTKMKEIMKDMSTDFFGEIEKRLNNIKSMLKASKISYRQEENLNKIILEQENRLKEANELYKNKNYYSASSYCFMISVQLNYVENVINFLEAENGEKFLSGKMSDTDNKIKEIENKISLKKYEMDNVSDIEVITIAEDRINDAKNNMNDAWKNYYIEKYFDSVYYLSYADARADTSLKWLGLTNDFCGSEINFSFNQLKNLSQIRIAEAMSFITYAKILGIDASEADDMIALARDRYNEGSYPSALFNAIAARAYMDAVMGMSGLDNNEIKNKITKIEEKAIRNINEAQTVGILPIMAINYYEYGKNLKDNDPESAFLYMTNAKHFAKVSKNLLEAFEGKKFDADSESIIIKRSPINHGTENERIVYIAIFVVGMICGIAINSIPKKKRQLRGRRVNRKVSHRRTFVHE